MIFQDENGGIVQRDGELLIHTDGTGLISEDLAEKCPTIMYKGKLLKSQVCALSLYALHLYSTPFDPYYLSLKWMYLDIFQC